MSYGTISVAPSGDWLGNDGLWSTFTVSLGSLPSPIELLPGSSIQSIWAVLPQGCWNVPSSNTPCSTSRGGLFQPNSSTTNEFINGSSWWSYERLKFNTEKFLGGNYSASYNDQGAYLSRDSVSLGGASLPTEVITSYTATLPYVGFLGLSLHDVVYQTGSGQRLVCHTLLESLKTSGMTVSSYWGYTAGAYNSTDFLPYTGSLVLGGYDAARGNANDVLTVDLGTQYQIEFYLYLNSVNISNPSGYLGGGENLGLGMYIDSVVPEIWLPPTQCAYFEQAFGLVWDDDREAYMITDDQNSQLLQQDATVELQLSAQPNSPETVTIGIPYRAFWQPISYPLASITDGKILHYFPLKRASTDPGSHQWVLGRVFLQHAYLAVDYDRSKFYVSQAQFPANRRYTNITTVYPPGVKNPNQPFQTHPRELSPGAIAGIAVGGFVLLAIILVLLWRFVYRPWKRDRESRKSRKSQAFSENTVGNNHEYVGFYADEEKRRRDEDEMYEKREMPADDPHRASITSRHEMPSPPLPQYSPGSRSPGSPGSPGSHMRNISAESAELPGDYLTARRLSPVSGGPWELPANSEYSSRAMSPMSPMELGVGSLRGPHSPGSVSPDLDPSRPNPSTNF